MTHEEACAYMAEHGNRAAKRRWAKMEKKRQKELMKARPKPRPENVSPHTNKG